MRGMSLKGTRSPSSLVVDKGTSKVIGINIQFRYVKLARDEFSEEKIARLPEVGVLLFQPCDILTKLFNMRSIVRLNYIGARALGYVSQGIPTSICSLRPGL